MPTAAAVSSATTGPRSRCVASRLPVSHYSTRGSPRPDGVGYVARPDKRAHPAQPRLRAEYRRHAGADQSTENVQAMPADTQAVTACKANTAASWHRRAIYPTTSDDAERRELAACRPPGDPGPIRDADLWANMARNLARQPEMPAALDLLKRTHRVQRGAAHAPRAGLWPAEQREASGPAEGQAVAHLAAVRGRPSGRDEGMAWEPAARAWHSAGSPRKGWLRRSVRLRHVPRRSCSWCPSASLGRCARGGSRRPSGRMSGTLCSTVTLARSRGGSNVAWSQCARDGQAGVARAHEPVGSAVM